MKRLTMKQIKTLLLAAGLAALIMLFVAAGPKVSADGLNQEDKEKIKVVI